MGNFTPGKPEHGSQDDLARRMDLLERENERLRRQIEGVVGPDNPCFSQAAFQKALRFYLFVFMLPLQLLFVLFVLLPLLPSLLPNLPMIGPIPLFDSAGTGTNHPGIGLGIIAFGGLAVGVIAIGGGAVGLVAIGGGAIGLVALGGGAVGVFAFGGGAAGYIAIGGGAFGRYALGPNAYGKAVFSMRRQDPEAVQFFVRWLPRLRAAITTPLPVVPFPENERPHES
ncbi:MAG TPA: hypothetical protein PKG54_02570 [Phycisphaerae bacterium]|jgi:hypothetical protein|nr:hypothetical protein [Phycisphaerae bacterium]HOB73386.1 hypothetical protein [Phycisphaerae bacterium]HOJ54962.1 hypothetical protein [Phycisphaerae bacterium]HOL25028.1 hypothetical protein [Phycisphaerae bacterium]HPP21329.1 hypothetical protein [Phycisphaerae bacterium]